MTFKAKHFYKHAKLFMILGFALSIFFIGILLRNPTVNFVQEIAVLHENHSNLLLEYTAFEQINTTSPSSLKKARRKEYLYRLVTNTTRSLIQMEIKARRLEENMRRIKEKTADLLWKNKDKALWHILFKNISRHLTLRHEFHRHAGLRRIMQDSYKVNKRLYRRKRS